MQFKWHTSGLLLFSTDRGQSWQSHPTIPKNAKALKLPDGKTETSAPGSDLDHPAKVSRLPTSALWRPNFGGVAALKTAIPRWPQVSHSHACKDCNTTWTCLFTPKCLDANTYDVHLHNCKEQLRKRWMISRLLSGVIGPDDDSPYLSRTKETHKKGGDTHARQQ